MIFVWATCSAGIAKSPPWPSDLAIQRERLAETKTNAATTKEREHECAQTSAEKLSSLRSGLVLAGSSAPMLAAAIVRRGLTSQVKTYTISSAGWLGE